MGSIIHHWEIDGVRKSVFMSGEIVTIFFPKTSGGARASKDTAKNPAPKTLINIISHQAPSFLKDAYLKERTKKRVMKTRRIKNAPALKNQTSSGDRPFVRASRGT